MIRHPVTRQRCWFNQIAFLNERTIDPEIREYLVDVYGADGLPFNTFYGNGDPVGDEAVRVINETYEAATARERLVSGHAATTSLGLRSMTGTKARSAERCWSAREAGT